jgi:predicted DNA-binding helix-hairpin-helix protein
MSGGLYANYDLKRVYYSAFSPIPDASSACRSPRRPCSASTGSIRPTG